MKTICYNSSFIIQFICINSYNIVNQHNKNKVYMGTSLYIHVSLALCLSLSICFSLSLSHINNFSHTYLNKLLSSTLHIPFTHTHHWLLIGATSSFTFIFIAESSATRYLNTNGRVMVWTESFCLHALQVQRRLRSDASVTEPILGFSKYGDRMLPQFVQTLAWK